MKLKDDVIKYKCDACSGVFKGKDINLVKPITNVEMKMAPASFIFIDKDGTIIISGTVASLDKGDMLLACPKCKQVHLFGFNVKEV